VPLKLFKRRYPEYGQLIIQSLAFSFQFFFFGGA